MRKLDPKKHPKLIAFLEKSQKVLKAVAVICFSLVIVLCVFFYTKACSEKNAAQLISASAEEASTFANTFEKVVDTSMYPSANLFYVRNYSDTLNGVTYSVVNNVLTMKGTATATVSIWLLLSQPLSAGTYSFSSEKMSFACFLYFNGTSERTEIYNSYGSNYTRTIGGVATWLQIVIPVDRVVDVSFGLMCNAGEIAYPFIPPLDMIYYDGYNAGYEAGETDGKESGYNEGLTAAQRGIFDGCTVTCTTYLSGLTNFLSVTPNYINNGVDFSFIFDRWITEQGGSQSVLPSDAIEFKIKFKEGIPFSAFSVYFNMGFSYVDWTTARVQTDFGTPNYKEYPFTTVKDDLVSKIDKKAVLVQVDVGQDNPQYISSLSFKCAWIPTFYKLQLISLNGGYTQGYNVGYYDGQSTNSQFYDNGYNAGKDEGYKNGYTAGKSDGFQEGFNQTKSGGFGWLISSVQEFLNTNFFGDFGVGTLIYVCIGCFMFVMVIKIFAR